MNERTRTGRVERWIHVERDPDGNLRYTLDYRGPDGRRVREPAGRTLTDARTLRSQREHEKATGRFESPRDKRKRLASERAQAAAALGPTLVEFVKRFREDYLDGRVRSDHYEPFLKSFLSHFGEDRRLLSIGPDDLDAWRAALAKQGLGPSSIRKRLISASTFFRCAVRWRVCTVNPAAAVERPAEPTGRTRYLSPEEFSRLLDAAEPWLKPIIRAAILSGARLREITGLTWADVDRSSSTVFLARTKTGRPRSIPASGALLKLLDEIGGRFAKTGPVFLGPDGKTLDAERGRNRVSQRTKAAMEAAGIEGASFHSLRHSFASLSVQAGVSLLEVGRVLGHSSPLLTSRYSHLEPRFLARTVEAVASVLDGSSPVSNGHLEDTSAAAGV